MLNLENYILHGSNSQKKSGRVIKDLTSPLTGAMAKLKADMGAAEHVNGDGQLDLLSPARAVVVVQHKRVVVIGTRLT